MITLGSYATFKSNYASPLHMVPKKTAQSGDQLADYRALNAQTIKDNYSVPNILDFTSNLHADATLLRHPIPGAKLSLWTDASDKAVGGSLLCNFAKTIGNPLLFVSETLEKSAEMVHIATENSWQYISVKRFRHMLEGRDFIIWHRPEASHVCSLMRKNPDKCSPRQWRHLDFISQFSTDVRHINGTRNAVADALSRIEVNHPIHF
ncbi:transposon Ty3-G Gag-Pol polyprotein [Trichonephila clavipes]|nr:transposon Ty3-G Gag-Pol polyprotein [Trichonephila clavipes]